MANKTRERAWEIIDTYLREIRNNPSVKSVILVGSLSDDTYTGNAGSDIDLVHIIYDRYDYSGEKKRITDLISKTENETDKDIPFSRTVYSEKHLVHPYTYDFEPNLENRDLVDRPIELFRVLDSGKILYGEDIIPSLERPTRDDVKKSVELGKEQHRILAEQYPDWAAEYDEMHRHPTIRIMTQIVLTTALSDYYFYTGKSCSSKYRILERVEEDLPGLSYLHLLELCHKNRFSPDEMTEAEFETMNREYAEVFLKRPAAWENA